MQVLVSGWRRYAWCYAGSHWYWLIKGALVMHWFTGWSLLCSFETDKKDPYMGISFGTHCLVCVQWRLLTFCYEYHNVLQWAATYLVKWKGARVYILHSYYVSYYVRYTWTSHFLLWLIFLLLLKFFSSLSKGGAMHKCPLNMPQNVYPVLSHLHMCLSHMLYLLFHSRNLEALLLRTMYTFLYSVVCLSVVCHIRAPCLNRSSDLDAIWQVHSWVQWHIVLDGVPGPKGRGDFGVEPPAKLQPNSRSYAATWRMKQGVGWTCNSNSAFFQIPLVVIVWRETEMTPWLSCRTFVAMWVLHSKENVKNIRRRIIIIGIECKSLSG